MPLALAFTIVSLQAQYNFIVQNQTASAFNTLSEAYANSVDGDTIYLPGGSFNLPAIDKSLVWIGVGYHPDSTTATYATLINNDASFSGNCDSSFITGIYFTKQVLIGSNGNDAENLTLFRCRIGGNLRLKYADSQSRILNARVSECIIDGTIDAGLGSQILVEKSIIKDIGLNFRESLFDRNIFSQGRGSSSLGYSFYFSNIQNCLIQNSVININSVPTWKIDIYSSTNNNFLNNIFAGNITFPQGTNTGANNLTGIDLQTVFEHIEGSLFDYSYLHNFHLKAESPGIGAGTSGTDTGLYGGTEPFKDGGLPFNPHIRAVSVGNETSNGLLNVGIQVGAQND